VAIACGSPAHSRAVALAVIGILAYPVGLLLGFGALLFHARDAIRSGQPNRVSRAITFLHSEYEPHLHWWELVEMLRRFLLVGIFVTVRQGSIEQLTYGAITALLFLALQVKAAPYRNASDDLMAAACSLCLALLFLCCVIYKIGALTDLHYLQARMSLEQRDDYLVPYVSLSGITLLSCVGAIIALGMIVLVQLVAEAVARSKLRRLRFVATKKDVTLEALSDPRAFHLFLSHAWPLAQDRMRIVKARIEVALPSCRVFLDVDNLKSGRGEAEVDKSECILVFCTKAYFNTINSMKELYRAVVNRRPILAMLEPDTTQDGGLDKAAVQALLTDKHLDKFNLRKKWTAWKAEGEVAAVGFDHPPSGSEVAAALFATEPIEWNRLPHFQDVTIRLIAQRGVLHDKSGELYLQGEAAREQVDLADPLPDHSFHLFCSEFNTGAGEIAEELKRSGVIRMGELKWTSDFGKLEQSDQMLVLLDMRTWTSGEMTAKLVEHIHAAFRAGVNICCVHEFPSVVGPLRHACEFALMFQDDWTPPHLVRSPTNLYKEIANALKGAEWRQPGMVALAGKIAKGQVERKPISFTVPDSYEPKEEQNPWEDVKLAWTYKEELEA